jgi:PIN domain nuclease of toxin-antitoxin system
VRFLLDTHILIWAALGTLRGKARAIVGDSANTLLFSSVSIWEIAIKSGLHKDSFDIDTKTFLKKLIEAGFEELPFKSSHAAAVEDLPDIHKDLFDRALVAQTYIEGVSFVTADKTVKKYSPDIIIVPPSK